MGLAAAPALILAAVLGVGRIPLPESALRFPSSSAFLGTGVEREVEMVEGVLRDAGMALRGGGPGPQQLAARWASGQLNEAEKVVVLLGGGVYHDPALLPAYAAAFGSGDLRLRQAAAVGLFNLVGLTPPLPSQVGDRPQTWAQLRYMAADLAYITETRPLVRVLVDSYYAGKGVRRPELFAFHRDGKELVRAIREIARPADLGDVLALWPVLERKDERLAIAGLIEMLTLRQWFDRNLDPHQPSGEWQTDASLGAVDQWVASMCQAVDVEQLVQVSLERLGLVARGGSPNARAWFAMLLLPQHPQFDPTAADQLMDWTGAAFPIDRHRFDSAVTNEAIGQLRELMPVSSHFERVRPGQQKQEQPRRR